jgi:lipopolysaccharide transport system ATP-binding protein
VLAVGDELFRRKCYAKMESIMAAGCTVLLVSHNSNTINEFCHRAILLDGGELLLHGLPKTVSMYYLRLMNASAENAAAVRKEIRQLNRDAARKNILSGRVETAGGNEPIADGSARRPVPFFIPELIPKSTLIQKNHDVTIDDIQLLTQSGERVNVLVMGEEYHLVFKVRFGEDAVEAGFGVAIKSQKGVNLCNGNLNGRFIPRVGKGQPVTAHFHFSCAMLPGNYYATLNVSANISGERAILIQVQDALVFKVLSGRKMDDIGGLIYCGQSLEVE